MKKPFFALLMAAALLPFAAAPSMAQTPPDGDGYGPPPAVMQQLQQIRSTYKTNALNALTPQHRDQVNAIIAQVNAGTLDRRDAAAQIDKILTPTEAQAVLAQGKSMRQAMRQVFEANRPQNDTGQGPPAPPPGGEGAAPNGERMHRTPDAGRILVMLSTNRRMRPPSGQPQQP